MRIALIVWLVCLVCVSLSPFDVKEHLHSMGRLHRLYHLVAFTVTAVLLAWNARTVPGRIVSGLCAVGIAIATEYLETLRFHNPFEWWDVCTDISGVLLGLLSVSAAHTFLDGRRPRSPQSTGS
jgi:hypothetical protein